MKRLKSLAVKQVVYEIDLKRSKRLLLAFVKRFNEGKAVRQQLRSGHVWLMLELLEIYRVVLYNRQSKGWPLMPGAPLPSLRTNNVQLSDLLNRTERSVQHLRQRLRVAKLITDEVWHGSNASYEVQLNPAILYLAKAREPGNHISVFDAQYPTLDKRESETGQFTDDTDELPKCVALPLEETRPSDEITPDRSNSGEATNPDTGQADAEEAIPAKNEDGMAQNFLRLSGNFSAYCNQLQQVTNKLNELEVGIFNQVPVNQIVEVIEIVKNHPFPVENPSKSVENPANTTSQGTRTGYETISDIGVTGPRVAARPHGLGRTPEIWPNEGAPAPPPETMAEALATMPADLKRAISREVDQIWRCALKELYQELWITPTEAERAKARLAEYFTAAGPRRYKAGTEEICTRITLVSKWIERGRRKQQKRWVPIPSVYFDHRNERGFRNTKNWYKEHLKKRAITADKIALTKAVRWYRCCLRGETFSLPQKAKKYGLRSPTEVYHYLVAHLAKRNAALVAAFQEAVTALRSQDA